MVVARAGLLLAPGELAVYLQHLVALRSIQSQAVSHPVSYFGCDGLRNGGLPIAPNTKSQKNNQ